MGNSVVSGSSTLFRTGWFVESLVSQVLVVFVIRTRDRPWASRPAAALAAASLTIVAIALLLPFTPLAALFRFEPPPGVFYAWLAAMVLSYLAAVEGAKQFFYARLAGPARRRGLPPPGP